jgi:hypothetical protein
MQTELFCFLSLEISVLFWINCHCLILSHPLIDKERKKEQVLFSCKVGTEKNRIYLHSIDPS